MAIDIKPSRKGLLHKKLGVPQDEPIPAEKLQKAKDSKSPALRKEANFAINAKGFKHAGNKRKSAAKSAPKRHRYSAETVLGRKDGY